MQRYTEYLVRQAVVLIKRGIPVPLTLAARLAEEGISIQQLEGKYSS